MKYEFIKIDLDTYKLVYTNKDKKEVSIEFKRTIEMGKELQSINAKARIEMFKNLTEMGLTKDDLIIKKKDGKGNTIYDETNYQEFEKKYIEEMSVSTIDELIRKCFNKNVLELFEDMGVDIKNIKADETKEIEIFTKKFVTIVKGSDEETPSREDN